MSAPPRDIIIRALEPEDAPEACALVRRVFDAQVAPLFSAEGVAEFHSYAQAGAMAQRLVGDNWGLIAVSGDRLVGVVEVRDNSHLAFFFVDQADQGKGVGKALIKRYLARCLQINPELQRVTVNASPNSREVYQALGYLAQGPQRQENGMRFTPMSLEMTTARRLGLAPAALGPDNMDNHSRPDRQNQTTQTGQAG